MNDVLPLRFVTPSVDDPGPTPKPALEPMLVSASDLTVLLKLSLRTIRSMDRAGRLPKPIRLGGSIRWRRDEICSWIDSGCPPREVWEARRAARS
jgi:predicted DNA-binding transcriptional regulator AlpA